MFSAALVLFLAGGDEYSIAVGAPIVLGLVMSFQPVTLQSRPASELALYPLTIRSQSLCPRAHFFTVMACCVAVFQPRLPNEDSFAATNVCLLPMTSVATCCVAVPTNAEHTFHDSKFLSRILGQEKTRKS